MSPPYDHVTGRFLGTPPADFACDYCGKIFKRLPSAIKKHKFCSRSCAGKWTWANGRTKIPPPRYGMFNHQAKPKVFVTCETCGKEVERGSAWAERDTAKFCSYPCRSKWYSENYCRENSPQWREGATERNHGVYRTREWFNARQAAIERDGGQCQVCGSTQRPHVHHIVSYGASGSHHVDNLIVLCGDHHTGNNGVHRQGKITFAEKYGLTDRFEKAKESINERQEGNIREEVCTG